MSSPPRGRTGGFHTLGLLPSIVDAVTALGYEEATPIQREAIPIILAGRDLLAQAATGTGKTAAFALPLIQRLLDGGAPQGGSARTRPRTGGLVLVPTRELAMQVAEAAHKYARGTGITVVPLYGGASMMQQMRALERGAALVVATPGRALDHLRRQSLDLSSVAVLVLDEADEMLDMGFAEDIDALFQSTPATRQTALFSATMPARLRAIAERHLREPERLTIAQERPAAGAMPRVRQVAYVVARAHKPAALQRVLDVENPTSSIVFCRTRLEVDALVETLNAHGYRAEALHGGMAQRQREGVMSRVRAGSTDLLIATDVAARGLDVQQLSHVFNYDVPTDADAYVHRIGRTGRAGREGTAITLAEPREHRLLRSIERVTKQRFEMASVPTVAELEARRLEATRAAVHARLVAGKLDDVRVIVESLAREFDVLDVAAAAVQLAHAELSGGSDREPDVDLPAPPVVESGREARPSTRKAGKQHAVRGEGRAVARLFIGAGRRAGVRPGDLVGAITNEAGLSSRDLGAIEITDRFSLVEVPEDAVDAIIRAMRRTTIRGEKVTVRRDSR